MELYGGYFERTGAVAIVAAVADFAFQCAVSITRPVLFTLI
jgi:hypothetical protein